MGKILANKITIIQLYMESKKYSKKEKQKEKKSIKAF